MHTYNIVFNTYKVEIIINKKLKHSYILIRGEGDIVLKTPYNSSTFIYDLLEKRNTWIAKHMQKFNMQPKQTVTLKKEILLFGDIVALNQHPYLVKKLQSLRNDSYEKIVACYYDFYKYQASIYITPRVAYFAHKMNLSYHAIKYRKMKRRWGSCSSQKVLTFNTQLMKIEKPLIDYVIVHELAHLVYMNHSPAFHQLVSHYLPENKSLRKQLREKSISLSNI